MMNDTLLDTELLIVRTFDAPAALVFAMWTDPVHFRAWMGPGEYACTEAQMDVRVGGRYRGVIRSTATGDSIFSGAYREVTPHTRLVFTWMWEDTGPSANIETLITITFEERNGKTVQTFHQMKLRNRERRDAHVRGWEGAFDKLMAQVGRLQETPQ